MDYKWLTRIGEGMLIGLGAAITFSIFQAMTDATDSLRAAEKKLLLQEEINIKSGELIEIASKENLAIQKYVQDEISRVSKNIDELALNVKSLIEANNLTGSNSVDLEQFTSKQSSQTTFPVIEPSSPWVIPNDIRVDKFTGLEELIQSQESISFD